MGVILYFDTDAILNNSFIRSPATTSPDIQYQMGINVTGSTIPPGSIVGQAGFDAASQLPTLRLASAATQNLSDWLGITLESIPNTAQGAVLTLGSYQSDSSPGAINTTGMAVSDPLFLSATPGALTATAPTIATVVAYVESVSTTGAIRIIGGFQVAAVSGAGQAMFYGLTAGTGNGGSTDYAATVAVNAAVPFPRLGPTTSAGIVAFSSTQFTLPTTGIYEVSWSVDFLEESQLLVKLGAAEQAHTCATSGAGTQQNTNRVLVSATAGDKLSICNASGNATALTVQTADGSITHAQAPSLIIRGL